MARRMIPASLAGKVRFWLSVLVGLTVLVVGAWVGFDHLVYQGRIHRGVTIAGVDVGGMDPAQAVTALQDAVASAAQNPITLASGDVTYTLMPEDVGTSVDVEGAVSQAMAVTRYDDFLTDAAARVELYFITRDVPLRGTVDDGLLEAELARIEEVFGAAGTGGGNGTAIDRPALTERLRSLLFSLHSTTVEVPLATAGAVGENSPPGLR